MKTNLYNILFGQTLGSQATISEILFLSPKCLFLVFKRFFDTEPSRRLKQFREYIDKRQKVYVSFGLTGDVK